MTKDYYIILGIASDASDEEVKSAYRQRVTELHPDHYGPDTGPFLEMQEAYSVLGDPERRRAYDRQARALRSRETPSGSRPEPLPPPERRAEPLKPQSTRIDLGEMSLADSFDRFMPSFDELFDRLRSNFSPAARTKAEHLESLTVDVPLTPMQAWLGGHVRLLVPAQLPCRACGGHGGVGLFECWSCSGQGVVVGEYPVSVAYPPGMPTNHIVQVPLDQYGIGNLYLTVRFRVSESLE